MELKQKITEIYQKSVAEQSLQVYNNGTNLNRIGKKE